MAASGLSYAKYEVCMGALPYEFTRGSFHSVKVCAPAHSPAVNISTATDRMCLRNIGVKGFGSQI